MYVCVNVCVGRMREAKKEMKAKCRSNNEKHNVKYINFEHTLQRSDVLRVFFS